MLRWDEPNTNLQPALRGMDAVMAESAPVAMSPGAAPEAAL